MIEHLIIGGEGLVGSAVVDEMRSRALEFAATSRREIDLVNPDLRRIPDANTLYLIAAMPGWKRCTDDPISWQVNRDAPIMLARSYNKAGAFVVFISSDVVDKPECMSSPYAMQKREVEAYINSIDGGIVRPTRVSPDRANELAKVIVSVGLSRLPGVTKWV